MAAGERADGAAGRPLRILHVFRAPLGGLFRHAIDLARGQIALGHEVGIFCDSRTSGPRADAVFQELGPALKLGVEQVPMSRYPDRTDVMAQFAFMKARRRLRPDVVHAHGSKGGLYARLPALLAPGRDYVTAYTPHGGSFNYKPGGLEHRVYMGVERLLERATDMFLFESAYIANRFEAYVGHKPRTAHRIVLNGISQAELEPVVRTQTPFDLLYLGELRSAKGVDTLIEALALLKSREKLEPSILVVGSGPEEASLRDHAAGLGVAGQMTFEPPGPIRCALARSRVMVIPSRAESLPYVILEAAGAQQPLVSTDVGGIPEIYGARHTHRLIKPDDPDALARAIAQSLAMTDADRQTEAADLASHVAENFTIEAMIDGVLAGYREALAKRRGR